MNGCTIAGSFHACALSNRFAISQIIALHSLSTTLDHVGSQQKPSRSVRVLHNKILQIYKADIFNLPSCTGVEKMVLNLNSRQVIG